jgi:hypothetical protein
VLAHHLTGDTELLVASLTVRANAASSQVMHANAVAGTKLGNLGSNTFDDSGDFVAKRQWQGTNGRSSGTIMGIGVANARCLDAH